MQLLRAALVAQQDEGPQLCSGRCCHNSGCPFFTAWNPTSPSWREETRVGAQTGTEPGVNIIAGDFGEYCCVYSKYICSSKSHQRDPFNCRSGTTYVRQPIIAAPVMARILCRILGCIGQLQDSSPGPNPQDHAGGGEKAWRNSHKPLHVRNVNVRRQVFVQLMKGRFNFFNTASLLGRG